MMTASPKPPPPRSCTKPATILLAAVLLAASPATRAALTYTGSVTNLDGDPWSGSGTLVVGYSGNASMQLTNGGSVTSLNSGSHCHVAYGEGVTADLTVHGAGCSLTLGSSGNLYLGEGVNSVATLTLSGGTRLTDPDYENHNIYLGLGVGSRGKMVVSGAGTLVHLTDWMLVGHLTGSQGRLVVENGGVCEASRVFIGYQAGSVGEAIVSGPGSILKGWLNESDAVGWSGRGSLTIENGGLAQFRGLVVGYANGSYGEVLVSGAGSRIENGGSSMVVGRGGSTAPPPGEGVVRLARGGVIDSTGLYVGASFPNPKGTMIFIIGNDGTGSIVPGRAVINGEVRLNIASLLMEVDAGVGLTLGQQFTLVDYLTLNGSYDTFQGVPEDTIVLTPNHHAFRINYATDLGAGDLAITATVVAPPTTDDDGDKLIDAWEVRCFGATDSPLADPALDPDGDGRDNACEHAAGTDPLDPASRCAAAVEGNPAGAPRDLAYSPYDPAVTYTVERATDLAGPWDPVVPTTTVVDGAKVRFTLPGGTTDQAFYRLRIER